MKRVLFSLLVASAMISCSAKDYTLNGKVHDSIFEGITISLQTFDGKETVNIGTQTVNNKQFKFTGVVEKPTIALLSFNDRDKSLRGNRIFILENARIDFTIDKEQNIIMRGTKQNDLLQSFENDMNKVASRSVVDSIQKNLYSQEEANRKIEEIIAKQKRIIADFVKKNVNTLAGTAIFMNTANTLDVEDKIAVLNLMNEETKRNPQIQAIAKQIEVEQRIAVGRPYTDFTLPDTNGNPFSLSQLVGKSDYVLIDFWASWCGPCLRSFPELTAFYNDNKGDRFEILGVSLDRDEHNWKAAIEKHGLKWKHVSDLKYWQSEAGQLYAVSSIPCTVLIDREGKIVGRNLSLGKIKDLISKK